jgi:plastocyanin
VKQAQAPKNSIRMTVPQASRRPAAFVGIFLFIIGGFALLQGYVDFSNVGGQVSASAVTIRIRPDGTEPASATVKPGTTITWINEDSIPHILTSSTFPTIDGKAFATSAIFPGSNTHVLVASNANPGSYTYISKTAQSIGGTIVIEALPSAAAVVQTQEVPETTQVIPDALPPSVASVTTPDSTIDDTAVAESPTVSGLPYNPHTVGSGDDPIPNRQGTRNPPAITKVASQPTSSPETGSEVWIVVILSIGTLLFVTRKSFRHS